MKTRRGPALRKCEIMDTALVLARVVGYQQVTREHLAARAACSPALISKYFGTMPNLKRAIMSAALIRRDLVVLAQGLAAGEPKARSAPEELRRAAMETCL